MLTSSETSSVIILLFLPEQTPSVVLDTKQTVHKFASVAVTVEVEVVRGKKILGFLTLKEITGIVTGFDLVIIINIFFFLSAS